MARSLSRVPAPTDDEITPPLGTSPHGAHRLAAAHATHGVVLTTGLAGLVAGAMSLAAGEYVSVHSQADTETADLARERSELADDPQGEERELKAIYVGRGIEPALAQQVAVQLMRHVDDPASGRCDQRGLRHPTATQSAASSRAYDFRSVAKHVQAAASSPARSSTVSRPL